MAIGRLANGPTRGSSIRSMTCSSVIDRMWASRAMVRALVSSSPIRSGRTDTTWAYRLSTIGTPLRSRMSPRGASTWTVRKLWLSALATYRSPVMTWRNHSLATSSTNMLTTRALRKVRRSAVLSRETGGLAFVGCTVPKPSPVGMSRGSSDPRPAGRGRPNGVAVGWVYRSAYASAWPRTTTPLSVPNGRVWKSTALLISVQAPISALATADVTGPGVAHSW